MSLLDYSQFGQDKLGYQEQLKGLDTDIITAMRNRALKQQADQETAHKNAELAFRREEHQDQLAKDAQARHDKQLQESLALQEKVNERIAAGDTPGARALVEAAGGAFPDSSTPPAAPSTPSRPPSPAQQGPADIHIGEDVAPPAGPADIHLGDDQPPTTDAIARRMTVPGLIEAMRARNATPQVDPGMPVVRGGNPDPRMLVTRPPDVDPGMTAQPRRPMRFDLGAIDINADIPKGQSSVTRLDPSTQGAAEMAPAEPPAPKPEAQKFTYKTPDGRTISLDPEQVRTAGRQKAAQDFLATHMPEADAIFQSAAGKPPVVAARIRAEATQQRADIKRIAAHIASGAVEPKNAASEAELAVRQRQGQSITEKDQFLEAGRNSRARMAADAARAARAGDAGPGEPDTKRMTVYNSQLTEAKRNSLAGEDLKQLRRIRESTAQLKDPNLAQMQTALDAIVTAASGGRMSVKIEQNARNAQDLLHSLKSRGYAQLTGRPDPEYVKLFRKITHDAQVESDHQLRSDAASFEHRVGAKSHWYKDPQMRPYVEDARRAYYEALGLGLPEQEQEGEPPVSNEEFINGH